MMQEQVRVDFDVDRVGEWSPYTTTDLTRDRIAAYAVATGETDQRLLDGDCSSIVFGVVPSWHEVATVFRTVAPQEHWHRVVHGEHSIETARPLVPGDRLTTAAAVRSIRPVSSGTVISVEALTTDADGELVIRQISTGFYLGVQATEGAGQASAPPPHGQPTSPVTTVRMTTDAALPERYAHASGDLSPIHLDDTAARAIGLPGVILHGMCVLAIAGRAVVEAHGGDPVLLRSLACRFSGVALPGDDLVVEVGDSSFTATSPGGSQVLSQGRFTMSTPAAAITERAY